MKKVIFLCLLSLSVCLSKPAEEQVSPAASVTPVPSGTPVDSKTVKTEQNPKVNVTEPPVQTNATAHTELKPQQNTSDVHTAVPATSTNTTTNTKPEDNKTTDKQNPPKEKDEKAVTKNETDTKVLTPKANATEPEKVVTTQSTPPKTAEVPKTPETPKSDEDKHVLQARGFDGASFIGGIILTLGLLAIGFMGFKYYKNQTERNYHTL